MKELVSTIYSRSDDLPDFECRSMFHSRSLFLLFEQTPRQKPFMAVVQTADGRIVGHLLAVVRHRISLFPPYIYSHCRILGEGEYEECEFQRTEIFGEALRALTQKLHNKVLYIEVSNLSNKMFGYKLFREQNYFHVHWMSIHNSLHSKAPCERLGNRMKRHIENACKRGVTTKEVADDKELLAFYKLLKAHNRFKLKRYIPDKKFFQGILRTGYGRLFITTYHNKVIGCCACIYSEGNAYLWYSAFLRKSFLMLHPDAVTIWHAIEHAHDNGYAHFEFMDVGLPFSKNPFREFILRFGGKPISTYRWFRFSPGWLNTIVSWLYRS